MTEKKEQKKSTRGNEPMETGGDGPKWTHRRDLETWKWMWIVLLFQMIIYTFKQLCCSNVLNY